MIGSVVLDACSGSRMMWFNKADQRALFADIRDEAHTLCDGRVLEIHPDIQMDFRDMPFPDNTFYQVLFDPPHLIHAGPRSWLALKYGRLEARWQTDIQQGFAECFRVLKPNGTLIFKWAECQIPLKDILALTPNKPLFGHRSGKRMGTHWMSFIKPPEAALIPEVLF